MKKVLMALVSLCVISSCKKDQYFGPIYPDNNDSISIGSHQLIIGCEGNFQYGNASIDVLNLDSNKYNKNVYNSVNQQSLGDVMQSFLKLGDTLFVVVNNSNVIRLLDLNTYKEIGMIDGVNTPRYIQQLNEFSFVVSSLYGNQLYQVSLADLSVENSKPLKGWSEKLFTIDQNLFVTVVDSMKVVKYDRGLVQEEEFTFDHELSYADNHGHQIYLAGQNNGQYYLSSLHTKTNQVNTLRFGNAVSGMEATENGVFVLTNNSVMKFSSDLTTQVMLFEHDAAIPYGFKWLDKLEAFAITDAKDYISSGELLLYSIEGELMQKFETGIIPQAIEERF